MRGILRGLPRWCIFREMEVLLSSLVMWKRTLLFFLTYYSHTCFHILVGRPCLLTHPPLNVRYYCEVFLYVGTNMEWNLGNPWWGRRTNIVACMCPWSKALQEHPSIQVFPDCSGFHSHITKSQPRSKPMDLFPLLKSGTLIHRVSYVFASEAFGLQRWWGRPFCLQYYGVRGGWKEFSILTFMCISFCLLVSH